MSSAEDRVLDAAKRCCERWGLDKVTIDDIANDSGVSRATLYRLFPGGKDVLFEALRVRELDEFFTVLRAEVEGAGSFEDLIVRTVVSATRELRADEHLALMLGIGAGRDAEPAHRRRPAADHPRRLRLPRPARRARISSRDRPRSG